MGSGESFVIRIGDENESFGLRGAPIVIVRKGQYERRPEIVTNSAISAPNHLANRANHRERYGMLVPQLSFTAACRLFLTHGSFIDSFEFCEITNALWMSP